jgi:predicted dehydrogenase
MDIICLGDGPRLAGWIAAARVHPHVRSIAVVSRNEPGADAGIEVRRYSTLQSACKEIKPGVALLTGAAALDGRQAVEALEHDMDVVLDRPDTLDLGTLMKLTELARSRKRLVIVSREDAARATAHRLRRLLRNVGSISHISYIDRRPRSDLGDVAANARYAQLIRFGLDQIESLRSLFDASPVRVMARYTEPSSTSDVRGTAAELLLELERNIHVQYFGSTGASHHEQSLWVEGKSGSLRSEGASVWWRKRGWPRFLLWRWWPGTVNGSRRFADAARRTFDLIQKSASGGASAEEARRAANATLALLGSVMRSSQESRIVDVADWMGSGERPSA